VDSKPVPVFAPEVPESTRKLLTSEPALMVPASRPAPKPRSDLVARPGYTVAGLTGLLVVDGLAVLAARTIAYWLLPDGAAGWVSGVIAAIGLLFFVLAIVGSVTNSARSKTSAEYHGKYLSAADWDEDAQRLMLRAQAAVRAVSEAEVSQRGLLDDIQNDVVLPEQLWDIGQILQKASVLRTRHRENTAGLSTAELAGVVDAQVEALRRTDAAMERKVAVLEKYADQVREADAALRAEAAVLKVSRDDDKYLELLASIASVDQPGPVQQLSEEAAELENRLTQSVAAARETGQALTLPSDDGLTGA